MDVASVRKLLSTAKAPLGRVGDVLITEYKDDRHDWLMYNRPPWLRVPVEPLSRCKHRIGRGHCRSAVSCVAIMQLCAKHQIVVKRLGREAFRHEEKQGIYPGMPTKSFNYCSDYNIDEGRGNDWFSEDSDDEL